MFIGGSFQMGGEKADPPKGLPLRLWQHGQASRGFPEPRDAKLGKAPVRGQSKAE
jgi:hypothetical protein